ncbi:BnaC09g12380D [Brassica napus]|uniref:BnaC09g12380D protein n=1 Tax=Brassica napus TaxID=3708 RepID=A0A078F9A6_BRANA|nr:BnaC09g12380D [Brassica napus]
MTVSKTTLLIVLVAPLSCVCISNARELMKPG